jgi:hypothetical protein
MIHRQGRVNALLHRRDPGRLQPATSVQAKDDPRLTESKPSPPLLKPSRQPLKPGPPLLKPSPPLPKPSPPPLEASPPLLLVDIDGVISLFAFEAGPPPGGSFHSIDGIPHFLSSAAAEHLLELAPMFDLAWASGWEEKANEYLPHLLGLPKLPYLSFEGRVGRSNAHWKLDAIDAYAGTRPLAWIDDALNEACHAWASARASPTLLVETTPAKGLTQREAAILKQWVLAPNSPRVHTRA